MVKSFGRVKFYPGSFYHMKLGACPAGCKLHFPTPCPLSFLHWQKMDSQNAHFAAAEFYVRGAHHLCTAASKSCIDDHSMTWYPLWWCVVRVATSVYAGGRDENYATNSEGEEDPAAAKGVARRRGRSRGRQRVACNKGPRLLMQQQLQRGLPNPTQSSDRSNCI